MNQASLKLLFSGATTKSRKTNLKTEKEGLFAGYILVGDNVDNLPYIEVTQSGITNKVLCDEYGRIVTSDLDILLIGVKGEVDRTLIESDKFGTLLAYEKEVIQSVNNLFTMGLKDINPNYSFDNTSLISHGPLNRYHFTKRSFLHFPMKIMTDLTLQSFGCETIMEDSIEKLQSLLAHHSSRGYQFDCHASWQLQ